MVSQGCLWLRRPGFKLWICPDFQLCHALSDKCGGIKQRGHRNFDDGVKTVGRCVGYFLRGTDGPDQKQAGSGTALDAVRADRSFRVPVPGIQHSQHESEHAVRIFLCILHGI